MYGGHNLSASSWTEPPAARPVDYGKGVARGKGYRRGRRPGQADDQEPRGQPQAGAAAPAAEQRPKESSGRGKRSKQRAQRAKAAAPQPLERSLSDVLAAFLAGNVPTPEQLLAHALEFATHEQGSQFLLELPQQQLSQVAGVLAERAVEVSKDEHGREVMMQLLASDLSDCRGRILELLSSDVVALSLDPHGCRVIQAAHEACPSLREQELLTRDLCGHSLVLTQSQHGNHVIQRVIESMPPSQLQFIIEELTPPAVRMARHPYGCRVLQRLLEHAGSEMGGLVEILLTQHQELCMDKYGNYVMQHVVEHGHAQQRQVIVDTFLSKMVFFCNNKYASNVVERALVCVHDSRQLLLQAMLNFSGPVEGSVCDTKYGQYVVGEAIKLADPTTREMLEYHLNCALEDCPDDMQRAVTAPAQAVGRAPVAHTHSAIF